MIKQMLAAAVLALVAGALAERARAAQTFVCSDGKMITVDQNGLEDAKRHDPCVAAYFGGTAVPRLPDLPHRNPVVPARAVKLAAPIPSAETRVESWSAEIATAPARSAVVRPIDFTAGRPAERQALTERLADLGAGTTQRVRVINATTDNGRWYTPSR